MTANQRILYLLSVLIVLSSTVVLSQQIHQDTVGTKISYDLDLGGGTYYQFTTFGNTNFNAVRIPQSLPRRVNNPDLRNIWGLNNSSVTDNPLFHGSYYFKFGAQFKFGENLRVTASINAEQRGFSDGVFSRQTRNFYPYLMQFIPRK